jgi:hypothetical protein
MKGVPVFTAARTVCARWHARSTVDSEIYSANFETEVIREPYCCCCCWYPAEYFVSAFKTSKSCAMSVRQWPTRCARDAR